MLSVPDEDKIEKKSGGSGKMANLLSGLKADDND